ncbi:MAG: hypothetical protein EOO89_02930 [Pedobacter sp.]|nr:MAG: hypothetical protein EOO89_02930 [Pedobacter sp.]
MIIAINTSDNERTAGLLDFFSASVSPENGCVNIDYENLDQVPSICRILVEADIDIFSISMFDPDQIPRP